MTSLANLRSYIPSQMKSIHRNKSNEQSILAAAICSFLASLFANVATSNNGFLNKVPLIVDIPLFISIYLAMYWVYVYFRNKYTRSRFYHSKRLDKYDICHVVNDVLLNDVLSMITVTESVSNDGIRRMYYQESIYNIDIILEFLDNNVDSSIIRENNTKAHPAGRAYNRVTKHQIESILCGISFLLRKARESVIDESNKLASEYFDDLEKKVNKLANDHLGIDDISSSIFFLKEDIT